MLCKEIKDIKKEKKPKQACRDESHNVREEKYTR